MAPNISTDKARSAPEYGDTYVGIPQPFKQAMLDSTDELGVDTRAFGHSLWVVQATKKLEEPGHTEQNLLSTACNRIDKYKHALIEKQKAVDELTALKAYFDEYKSKMRCEIQYQKNRCALAEEECEAEVAREKKFIAN